MSVLLSGTEGSVGLRLNNELPRNLKRIHDPSKLIRGIVPEEADGEERSIK